MLNLNRNFCGSCQSDQTVGETAAGGQAEVVSSLKLDPRGHDFSTHQSFALGSLLRIHTLEESNK